MSRSRWKFNYVAQDFNLQYLENIQTNSKELVIQDRATYITEEMLGNTIHVYNGLKYFTIKIESNKIGYRLGEFAPSKKKVVIKKVKKSK